jgi:hypothetical protein
MRMHHGVLLFHSDPRRQIMVSKEWEEWEEEAADRMDLEDQLKHLLESVEQQEQLMESNKWHF